MAHRHGHHGHPLPHVPPHEHGQLYPSAEQMMEHMKRVIAGLRGALAENAELEASRRQELVNASKELAVYALQAGEEWMASEGMNLPRMEQEAGRLRFESQKASERSQQRLSQLNTRLANQLSQVRELDRTLDIRERFKKFAKGSSSAQIGNALGEHAYEADRIRGYQAMESTFRQAMLGHTTYERPVPPPYEEASGPSAAPARAGTVRRPRPDTIYMDMPLTFEDLNIRPPSSHSRRGSGEHRRNALPAMEEPTAEIDERPGSASGRRRSSSIRPGSSHSMRYRPGMEGSPPRPNPNRRSWVPESPVSRSDLVSPVEESEMNNHRFTWDSVSAPTWDAAENEPTVPVASTTVHEPGPRDGVLRINTGGHGRELQPHEREGREGAEQESRRSSQSSQPAMHATLNQRRWSVMPEFVPDE
ncbi:hypothetical protein JCM10450v2_006330 [Rhodotorula kratochvilovae]